MKFFYKFFVIILYHSFIIIRETNSLRPILFVLLYDGFRTEYLYRGLTPTLNNFKHNGVHAPYMDTVYPALAQPAMHSISTGLYPETHGVTMRDDKQSDLEKAYIAEQITKTVPIWQLNEKNGGKSACMMWYKPEGMPECKPYYQKYERFWSYKKRADKVIEWLNVTDDSKRPNLVLFYVEEADRFAHIYGPSHTRNTTLIIRRLDLLTKYIIQKLIELKIYHITNIMILSDHGMISTATNMVLDKTEIKFDGTGLVGFSTDNRDDVNGRINFKLPAETDTGFAGALAAYKKAIKDFYDIGLKENQYTVLRIPPGHKQELTVIEYAACAPLVFNFARSLVKRYNDNYKTFYASKELFEPSDDQAEGPFGVHGYLRQNDAIFMAKGPMFARYKKIDPLQMVDLYSAFTVLLNIRGDFEREGNFSRVAPIFNTCKPIEWIPILVSIAALSLLFILSFYFLVQYILDVDRI